MRKSTFIALVWSEPGLLYNLAATQHLQPAWGHFQPIQVYPFKLTFDFFWCSAPSVGWFCDHIYYILIINEQLYVKDDNDYYVQQVHYSTLTKEWYQILRRTGRPFFTCPVSTYNEFWNIYNYSNSIKNMQRRFSRGPPYAADHLRLLPPPSHDLCLYKPRHVRLSQRELQAGA